MKDWICFALLIGVALPAEARDELRIPAFTAYLEPNPEGARVAARSGITGWDNSAVRVVWCGELKATGQLDCSLALRLPTNSSSRLRLSVGGTSREAVVQGNGTNLVAAQLGSFEVASPGYHRIVLESLNQPSQPAGDLEALILDGPAAREAHFNLQPRRNAASVHLTYPLPGNTNAAAFYCEVTAIEDPVWTFYMACGWHRGYFGMQVNSPTERRIIFSVWDSGQEAVDRQNVQATNRVQLVAKGEGVIAGDFGNEGTGGHSHWVYPWKTGEKQRFLVTAAPADAAHTIYAGYYFVPDQRRWQLISSWNAPQEGGYLRRLHSFSENFGGANGQLRRKALFGNQWMCSPRGSWAELLTATFSCDQTGRQDRFDRFMDVEAGQFVLSQGGFIPGFTAAGAKFARPATAKIPPDLPPIP